MLQLCWICWKHFIDKNSSTGCNLLNGKGTGLKLTFSVRCQVVTIGRKTFCLQLNVLDIKMCGSRKYPYPPTEGICRMTPLPSGFSKIGPPNLPPPLPSRISKIFAHPLEILLSLTEVNKEVVLFPRMPNFVSFVYFLLNCITDKRIPYENFLCAQVTDKFCAFHVISIEFYNSANEMQGRVGNITVLFSYCIKKKASLEEV